MPEVLTGIWNDHAQMKWLLDALERQLVVFRQGATPDYEIVGGVIDYCLSYPEQFHHPKEDAILECLERRDPDAAAELNNLTDEHEHLNGLTRKFAAAVTQVLNDQIVPYAWFDDIAMEFIDYYRKHIDWEETVFLPATVRGLTEQDWNAVDTRFALYHDPVFGEQGEERFIALRNELLTMDRDDLFQTSA
jgi:hemerythrin-like domain-containing protein